jgi:hypothetical protein
MRRRGYHTRKKKLAHKTALFSENLFVSKIRSNLNPRVYGTPSTGRSFPAAPSSTGRSISEKHRAVLSVLWTSCTVHGVMANVCDMETGILIDLNGAVHYVKLAAEQ